MKVSVQLTFLGWTVGDAGFVEPDKLRAKGCTCAELDQLPIGEFLHSRI